MPTYRRFTLTALHTVHAVLTLISLYYLFISIGCNIADMHQRPNRSECCDTGLFDIQRDSYTADKTTDKTMIRSSNHHITCKRNIKLYSLSSMQTRQTFLLLWPLGLGNFQTALIGNISAVAVNSVVCRQVVV